jgi:RimJ/RimL family protein N-acetyltransferase
MRTTSDKPMNGSMVRKRRAANTLGRMPVSATRRPVELRGELIVLRPFDPEEIDAVWHGLSLQDEAAHPRRTKEDRSPTPPERFRNRLGRSGRLRRGCLDLAIDRRGRLVGLIQARTKPLQCLPAGVFEVGVVLFQAKDRGKGYGREAVDLVTQWLFDTASAERVQAGTDAKNVAMRAVLEHLGFRLEGIARSYQPMGDGTRVDGAMYALVRTDLTSGAFTPP